MMRGSQQRGSQQRASLILPKDNLKIMRSTLTRSWLIAVPLVCISVGCNSATTTNTVAETSADTATQAPPATDAAPTNEGTRIAAADKPEGDKPKETSASADKNSKYDPAYRIADPMTKFGITEQDLKNAPPEEKALFAAMDHVKVPPPAKDMKVPDAPKVVFETSKGKITVELNGKEAPLHTKSFLHLTKLGFYDGTIFHRFADLLGGGQGRIVQGGDPFTKVPTTQKLAGQGGPGYEVPREHNKLKHSAMVLAAARSQDPNSAGSQFYFTLDPVPFLDEGDGYTVFGKVVDGKDVVMKLQQGDALKKVTVAK